MPSTNENKLRVKRFPSYLLSIIVVFIVPAIALFGFVWKAISKKAFFISAAIIAIIGWTWSWTVTSHVWWSFGYRHMLGWDVIPHLPAEEVLFYPFGGILCIFLYIAAHRVRVLPVIKSSMAYWVYLTLGILVFGGFAFITRENHPNYLTSQLVTYNLLCCLCLAPFVSKEMNLVAMGLPVIILLPVGYLWDFTALKYGWWDFHAVTQIRIGPVPLDEFNFFFYAQPSAISIYLVICRILKTPPMSYKNPTK